MDDMELRTACARALGWEYDETLPDRYGRWKKPFDDPGVPISTAWIPMAEPPPLDGNTAIALLERAAYEGDVDLVADCVNNTVFFDVDGCTVDVGSISARNIILGALLALGEISENDVAV